MANRGTVLAVNLIGLDSRNDLCKKQHFKNKSSKNLSFVESL